MIRNLYETRQNVENYFLRNCHKPLFQIGLYAAIAAIVSGVFTLFVTLFV